MNKSYWWPVSIILLPIFRFLRIFLRQNIFCSSNLSLSYLKISSSNIQIRKVGTVLTLNLPYKCFTTLFVFQINVRTYSSTFLNFLFMLAAASLGSRWGWEVKKNSLKPFQALCENSLKWGTQSFHWFARF